MINSADHFSSGGFSEKGLYGFFSAVPSGAWRRTEASLPNYLALPLVTSPYYSKHVTHTLGAGRSPHGALRNVMRNPL
jgi:hypothetical protein